MKYYHKIHAPFMRDRETHKLIEDEWAKLEFEYLGDLGWVFTEKIDGTNIAIEYIAPYITDAGIAGPKIVPGEVRIHGRTARSQIQSELHEYLKTRFTPKLFSDAGFATNLILYGEGVGPKVNNGAKYSPTPEFILFDVMVGNWMLSPNSISEIANRLGIPRTPVVLMGCIWDGIDMVRGGLKSAFGDFEAEGIVGVPLVPLWNRSGERVITKIKSKDFPA